MRWRAMSFVVAMGIGAMACGPLAQEQVSSTSVTARSCGGCHDSYASLSAPVLTSTVVPTPVDTHHETAMTCVDCHDTGATQGGGVILSRKR